MNKFVNKLLVFSIGFILGAILPLTVKFIDFSFYTFNSKAAQGMTKRSLIDIHGAQEEYKLKNGGYADNIEKLDINFDDLFCNIYLGKSHYVPQEQVTGAPVYQLPAFFKNHYDKASYNLYATKQLDRDPCLDICLLVENGDIYHVSDDISCEEIFVGKADAN